MYARMDTYLYIIMNFGLICTIMIYTYMRFHFNASGTKLVQYRWVIGA